MLDFKKIEEAVEGVLHQEAMELVDMRYLCERGRWILRFYLDKHNGVSLDDCERLSQRIGAVLDAMDIMPHAYSLEVSSPGMDRILKKKLDFEKFQGHRVKILTKAPMEGRRRFGGYLKGVEGEGIVLACGDSLLRVGIDAIEEARLDPDIHL